MKYLFNKIIDILELKKLTVYVLSSTEYLKRLTVYNSNESILYFNYENLTKHIDYCYFDNIDPPEGWTYGFIYSEEDIEKVVDEFLLYGKPENKQLKVDKNKTITYEVL